MSLTKRAITGGVVLPTGTAVESGEVIFQLADPSRAGIVIPSEQPENEDVLMLIMPMLLND